MLGKVGMGQRWGAHHMLAETKGKKNGSEWKVRLEHRRPGGQQESAHPLPSALSHTSPELQSQPITLSFSSGSSLT